MYLTTTPPSELFPKPEKPKTKGIGYRLVTLLMFLGVCLMICTFPIWVTVWILTGKSYIEMAAFKVFDRIEL